MPALKDRRLTGKVLHGAHFPMKSFVSAGKASLLLRDLLRYKCRIRSFALTMKTQSNSGFSLPRLVLMLFLFCTGLIIAVLASVGTPLSAEGPTETQQPSGPKSGHSYKNDVSPPLRDLPHWREGEGKPEHEANENPKIPHRHRDQADPVIQNKHAVDAAAPSAQVPTPLNTFDGIPVPRSGLQLRASRYQRCSRQDAIRSDRQ
jgi:hypothetical protein